MRPLVAITVALAVVSAAAARAGSMTIEAFEFPVSQPIKREIKWPSRKITVALSSSLATPGPNFKIGSDVMGAVHRAFLRWSNVARINFVLTSSSSQSISGAVAGDGISLITIADTRENNAMFDRPEMTGRTRVFYDADTGIISEADVCINPHPSLNDGTPVQFSTDGTPGTYDLETTFTHEIGHLLGLDHSIIWASTMQAHQALNGVYGLPALHGRTITNEDLERVLTLYGQMGPDGAISGKLSVRFSAAQVWVENVATGRVAASTLVLDDGTYTIRGLAAGHYRVLVQQSLSETLDRHEKVSSQTSASSGFGMSSRATEISGDVVVGANTVVPLEASPASNRFAQYLNPRFIGMNGDMSTVALPLEAGKTVKVYVGGEGLNQVLPAGISVTSPFFTVNANTITREDFNGVLPVVGFDVTVAPNAPFGDYTIRLQSTSGEISYLPGSITIDPAVNSTTANPVDDTRFFVSQQYRDFLGRDPDSAGLEYWTENLRQCGEDASCIRSHRVGLSAAFFGDNEFQETGSFVYGLFRTLGRRPTYAEFTADRNLLIGGDGDFSAGRKFLAAEFVRRREFLDKYPATMNGEQFVSALLAETQQITKGDASLDRAYLLKLYDGSEAGRANIVSLVITSPGFVRAEYNRVYVLMQYFAYLRRDPDEAGYSFWLNTLQNKSARDSEAFRAVACAFLTSAEYQSRFGMIITHSSSECGR